VGRSGVQGAAARAGMGLLSKAEIRKPAGVAGYLVSSRLIPK
jgi:hypothetical protein